MDGQRLRKEKRGGKRVVKREKMGKIERSGEGGRGGKECGQQREREEEKM